MNFFWLFIFHDATVGHSAIDVEHTAKSSVVSPGPVGPANQIGSCDFTIGCPGFSHTESIYQWIKMNRTNTQRDGFNVKKINDLRFRTTNSRILFPVPFFFVFSLVHFFFLLTRVPLTNWLSMIQSFPTVSNISNIRKNAFTNIQQQQWKKKTWIHTRHENWVLEIKFQFVTHVIHRELTLFVYQRRRPGATFISLVFSQQM